MIFTFLGLCFGSHLDMSQPVADFTNQDGSIATLTQLYNQMQDIYINKFGCVVTANPKAMMDINFARHLQTNPKNTLFIYYIKETKIDYNSDDTVVPENRGFIATGLLGKEFHMFSLTDFTQNEWEQYWSVIRDRLLEIYNENAQHCPDTSKDAPSVVLNIYVGSPLGQALNKLGLMPKEDQRFNSTDAASKKYTEENLTDHPNYAELLKSCSRTKFNVSLLELPRK